MYRVIISAASMALACSACAVSSTQESGVAPMPSSPAASVAMVGVPERTYVLPANTRLTVAVLTDISSKTTNVGDALAFTVVDDVVENGVVAIPRGTPVKAVMIWKTRRAIGGKSGKFEIEFKSISLSGRKYTLRGKHRQEGRGNTVGALLVPILVTGRSALMVSGQTVNAFTAEPLPYY